MIEAISWILMCISGAVAVTGAIGLLRFPDFYTRTHAATLVSMGGMSLALLALMLQTLWSIQSAKILFIIVINLMALPSASHIIAKVAYESGIKPSPIVRNEWKKQARK